MKKFFSFGKSKDDDRRSIKSVTRSPSGAESFSGYVVRDKDLGKIHKAAWSNDVSKIKQLAKKDHNTLDKDGRYFSKLVFLYN